MFKKHPKKACILAIVGAYSAPGLLYLTPSGAYYVADREHRPMQTQKKYQQVIAAMKREILEGNLEPGAPFMTDMVAVRRYGVSRITVRRAFDQLVREGCLSRTRGRGTVVRAHPGQGEYLFAFLGQSLVRNGIEPSLIMGIEGCLVRHESSLILCNTENSPRRTTKYVQRLIRMGVDGVIFIPLLDSPDINAGIAETLLKARIPCVAVSRAIPGLEARISTVLPDNYDGGRQVMKHLLSLGHRRIAFYRELPVEFCTSLAVRRRAYIEALKEAGIEPDSELDTNVPSNPGLLRLKRWMSLPDPPTAIFAADDTAAQRALQAAETLRIRVPEDLSIAGFDDLSSNPTSVPLTSIHVEHTRVGETAAMHLLHLAQESEHPVMEDTILPVSLVIRQSTGINPRMRHAAQTAT